MQEVGNIAHMSPEKAKHIHESFAAQTMMATMGAELTAVSNGSATIQARILPGSLQQHGFAHAGLTFSIGDSAAGYAALSTMPDGHEVLTTEMKINLLAPAKGDLLIARGRVIKAGRRLVIVQADVYAQDHGREIHIALLTGTMMPLAPE